MFDLSGRNAIVTGGNGGIGLGMARGLARAGASVLIVARNAEKNAAAVAELRSLGARAEAFVADLTREDQVRSMAEHAQAQFGPIHILVNNAGTNIRKMPQEYSLDEWRSVIDINLTSAFLCSQAAYPSMCAAGGGKVIAIGSMTTIFGAPFTAPYGATKGGIVQMTRAMAAAWAKDNIQCHLAGVDRYRSDTTRAARRTRAQ
jgi:2-deoxy-D-gluconate 3-dehydrogenase